MIFSMTGFASRGFSFQRHQFRVELKSLNHRFLEIKFRIPREWNALELPLRALIEKKIKRGTFEVWIERLHQNNAQNEVQLNMAQAFQAYGMLSQLKDQFQISEGVTVRDLVSFPEVLHKGNSLSIEDAVWPEFQKLVEAEVSGAVEDLLKMRASEGEKLKSALLAITAQFKVAHERLLSQRDVLRNRAKDKVKKRIEQCFEAYQTPDAQLRAVMETRIAQEIAIALDRLDIEEELTRYTGHIVQLEQLLKDGGAVGKKLDFLLQELNREVNTLGNKSQDLEMSQEVIQLKMWVEQLREQCMNLE